MQRPNENYIAELVKLGVTQGSYPNPVFTYMPIDNMSRIEPIFQKSVLWFSNPTDFNDPFDCKVYPVIPSDEDMARYLSTHAENALPEDYAIIREGIKVGGAETVTKQAIADIINKYGVKCFTPKHDNLLMWAHYANSHTGICLEFDVMEDSHFFVSPINVNYEDEYPEVSFLDKTFTTKLLNTKSKDWFYEEEFRVYKKGAGYHNFIPSSLRSVIFGCRATEENISRIISVVRSNPMLNHVRFYKSRPNDRAFKLDFFEINPT